MKRTILATLAIALGATSLMAQLKPKSKGEADAINALLTAARGGDSDATIKAADDLLTKYSDTVYKAPALDLEAGAYHKKGDDDHAQVYAEQAIQADPKDYQAPLLVAETIVQHTRENDLDKEEKLAKAEKDLNLAMENTKAAPKPNPQTPDAQWDEFKKSEIAEEQANMGRVFLLRKKFDEAVANLQPALEADPQPAYFVWLATAQVGADKNDEALATCSKLLEQPNLLPIFKQVISGIRAQALMAKAKAAPGKQ